MPAESWFPITIYYEDIRLDQEIKVGVLQAIEERRKSETFELYGGITASNSPNDLHLDPRVARLFHLFQPNFETFFYEVLGLDGKRIEFYVGRCWPVIQIDNGFSGMHHFHRGSVFSGVFYLQAPPGSGALEFRKPGRLLQDAMPKAKSMPVNFTTTTYPAVENRLVMFNSEIEHRRLANEHPDTGDRIAMAFDIFAMSSLDDYESGMPQFECLQKIG